MALLKSYSCAKCGGVLHFDESQEVFDCPFCGSGFTYTDFHREDLLKQARTSIAKENYLTAADKFKTILNDNPGDFEALQGLILARAKIPSIDVFEHLEQLASANCKDGENAAIYAKTNLKEEAEYFDLIAKMFSAADSYFRSSGSYNEFSDSAREAYKELECIRTGYIHRTNRAIKIYAISLAFYPWLFVVLAQATDSVWPIVLCPVTAIIAYIVIKVVLYASESAALKRRSEQIGAYQNASTPVMLERVDKYKKSYEEAYSNYIKFSPDAEKYAMPKASSSESEKGASFTDIVKTINCAKCGGLLELNKEKRLYQCNSCGVAYGASLFFDNPLKKAERAIKYNDYSEADQRYAHMLMVDPSDFDALLGRILCAGFWENIHSIELVDEGVSDVVENNLKERTSEAVLHSNEEFMSFFEGIKKLTELYCEHENLAQEISRYDEKLEYYSRNWTVITAKPGAEPVIKKEQSKLLSKKADASDKKNLIRFEFDRLKTKILRESIHLFSAKQRETDNG